MKIIIFLSFLAALAACTPNVLFLEPQPPGARDMKSFPVEIRGIYMAEDDSSIFVLRSKLILEKFEEDLATGLTELIEDENIEIEKDTLVMLDLNLRFPVRLRNDSVFGLVEWHDTVFSISRGDRLRKLKKDYFLNIYGDSLWMVLKLQFGDAGKACLCGIDQESELEIFEQNCDVDVQTHEDGEPERYILNPSRKEFRKLLKLETFTDTAEYIRVSQEVPR